MIAGLCAVVSNFVPIFYGPGYEKVGTIICVISPIIIAIGLSNVTGIQYLIQVKKQNILTITVVIGAVVNVIFNLIFINLYKSIGAAIATVVAEIVIVIAQLVFVRKDIDIKNAYKGCSKYIISAIIMFVLAMLLQNVTDRRSINLILQVIVGIASYFGVLICLRDDFMQEIIGRIIGKFRKFEK